MVVVGIDVSSTCTGVSIIDLETQKITLLHIDFKKIKNFWQKIDHAKQEFQKILKNFEIKDIFVEEPLIIMGKGTSSAGTIAFLNRFNAIICYILREITQKIPIYISSAAARKNCGIKIIRKSICGMDGKHQSFEFMRTNDLKDFNFPKKKTGKYKDFVYDECDSYIVAKGGILQAK